MPYLLPACSAPTTIGSVSCLTVPQRSDGKVRLARAQCSHCSAEGQLMCPAACLQRPYDNWERLMFDCADQEFGTVMSALKSNNPRWGGNQHLVPL
jgi:hypothetical protein